MVEKSNCYLAKLQNDAARVQDSNLSSFGQIRSATYTRTHALAVALLLFGVVLLCCLIDFVSLHAVRKRNPAGYVQSDTVNALFAKIILMGTLAPMIAIIVPGLMYESCKAHEAVIRWKEEIEMRVEEG